MGHLITVARYIVSWQHRIKIIISIYYLKTQNE